MTHAAVIQGDFPHGLRPAAAGALRTGARASAMQLPPHLAPLAAGGQPLAPAVRQKMEAAFHTGFADVRIHVGPQPAAIGARAFTHGTHIHFAPGRYDPSTPGGEAALAHELAHVVQQRAGRVANPFGSGIAIVHDPRLEAEADQLARRAIAAAPKAQRRAEVQRVTTAPQPHAHVQRAIGAPQPRVHVQRATAVPQQLAHVQRLLAPPHPPSPFAPVIQPGLGSFIRGAVTGGSIVGSIAAGAVFLGANAMTGGLATVAAAAVTGAYYHYTSRNTNTPPQQTQIVRASRVQQAVVVEDEFEEEKVDLSLLNAEAEQFAEDDEYSLDELAKAFGISTTSAPKKAKKVTSSTSQVLSYDTRKARALRDIEGEVRRCAGNQHLYYQMHHSAFTIGHGPFSDVQKSDIRNAVRDNVWEWVEDCPVATNAKVLHGKLGKGQNFNVGAYAGRRQVLNLHFIW